MISAIIISGDRLVNIVVCYRTKMFCKPVRETSTSLTDVEFIAFAAGYAINDVRRGTWEIRLDYKIRFQCKNDGGWIKRLFIWARVIGLPSPCPRDSLIDCLCGRNTISMKLGFTLKCKDRNH